MKYFIYSRNAIEALPPHDVPHIIVSISTPGDVKANIKRNEMTEGLLRLWFSDICDDALKYIYKRGLDQESEEQITPRLFSREQARQIIDFVKAYPNVEHFIVHCDAGLSRSPGVAAAISKIYDGDDSEIFKRYHPNSRVHRMILEEHFAPGEQDGNSDHRDQGS